MAVLPKENIHKMKLKPLLNRLLIFWGASFFSQGCAFSHWWISLIYFFLSCGTIGSRMHLCQEIFAILILCRGKIIEKNQAPPSVGCWQHFSLQLCVSIRGPGLSGGLFPLLFSISLFYLDLKWCSLNNLPPHCYWFTFVRAVKCCAV